jgi:mRNA interferase RelE/StbE
MDAFTRQMILSWITKNLVGTDDPRRHGKGLSENLAGLWRYRIGNYRVIAEIFDAKITIEIIEIGHRSKAYS